MSKYLHKILLTGGRGFLGKHVYQELIKKGYKKQNIIIPRSKKQDLRNRNVCRLLTKNMDLVIHLAANVGGIGKNSKMPGDMFYDNAIMGIELMEAARINKVKKFVTIGSVCAYPKYASIPFRENNLWDGYPEETNAPFGLAKKMLLVQGLALRQQYGFNVVHLMPTNLYGPYDDFDIDNSHVIPALIRKISEAKRKKSKSITIWGTGRATREFLYVEDAARAIVLALEKYDKAEPVNLSGGEEISIKELVKLLGKLHNYQGKIIWDKSKPDGQPRRRVDGKRAKKEFGYQPRITLKQGLERTIKWYLKNK